MNYISIKKEFKSNLKASYVCRIKHKEYQENLRNFNQNHRKQEYQDYQRELEKRLIKG